MVDATRAVDDGGLIPQRRKISATSSPDRRTIPRGAGCSGEAMATMVRWRSISGLGRDDDGRGILEVLLQDRCGSPAGLVGLEWLML